MSLARGSFNDRRASRSRPLFNLIRVEAQQANLRAQATCGPTGKRLMPRMTFMRMVSVQHDFSRADTHRAKIHVEVMNVRSQHVPVKCNRALR